MSDQTIIIEALIVEKRFVTHVHEECECEECGGSGRVTCYGCNGSGYVEREIEVTPEELADRAAAERQEALLFKRYGARRVASIRDYWQGGK